MSNEDNKSVFKRILGFILRNPINISCLLGIIYCSVQAFIFDNQPIMHKGILSAIVIIWGVLFVINHLFKLIMLLAVIIALIFGYNYWTGKDKRLCEENGGYWNSKKEICEEKQPWWHQILNLLK